MFLAGSTTAAAAAAAAASPAAAAAAVIIVLLIFILLVIGQVSSRQADPSWRAFQSRWYRLPASAHEQVRIRNRALSSRDAR